MLEMAPSWHPILVHFTIALLATSSFLFAAGFVFSRRQWSQPVVTAAYCNLWLGAALTILTVAAGANAYLTVAHYSDSSHAAMVDPRGRVFKGLGRRPAPLAMRPASPRDAILAQALENAVLPISITRTGS